MDLILALCLFFQRDRKPLQSRKVEHRSTDLTTNARVCLHAEDRASALSFFHLTINLGINTSNDGHQILSHHLTLYDAAFY